MLAHRIEVQMTTMFCGKFCEKKRVPEAGTWISHGPSHFREQFIFIVCVDDLAVSLQKLFNLEWYGNQYKSQSALRLPSASITILESSILKCKHHSIHKKAS